MGAPQRCSVCLENAGKKELNEAGGDGVRWMIKLKNIVPEVKWLEGYLICEPCTEQLDGIHQFRVVCISKDEARKLLSSTTTAEDDDEDEEENGSDLETERLSSSKLHCELHCSQCENSFDSKTVLEAHLKKCKPKPPKRPKQHECPRCGKSYTIEKVMLKHSTQCNGIKRQATGCSKDFTCEVCGKAYTSQKILKAHQCLKPSKRSRCFTCEVCGVPMTFAKSIVEHCVAQHGMEPKTVKPYTCDECPSRFSTSANLIQHKKYHSGSRSHICSFCGKAYITKNDLTVHEYTHFNRRNYVCEFCDKAFNTNKNLRSHKLVVHTESHLWKYACDLCDKRFPLKSGYEQHMRRHMGDKRYPCHICQKPFISRSELQKHMGFHSTVKAYKCDHCDKGYKERKVYEIHLARAHGMGDAKVPVRVKNYTCHLCPSSFFDKQKLTRHICTHTGERPHACTHCEKKFTDKYYLKQHLKSAHDVSDGNNQNKTATDEGLSVVEIEAEAPPVILMGDKREVFRDFVFF